MKNIFITILLLGLTTKLFSQSIPNSGFEKWSKKGPMETADNWSGSPGVTKTTSSYKDSFAMQLKAGIFTNPVTQKQDTILGIAYTGKQGMGPGTGTKGFAFTTRPDSLTGWYSYVPSGTDTALIKVSFTKWNTSTNKHDLIGETVFFAGSSTNYKRFSFDLKYKNSSTPDTATIELMSSTTMPGHLNLGSVFTVDQLSFVSPTGTGINTVNSALTKLELLPNPSENFVSFKLLFGVPIKQIELLDITGKIIQVPITEDHLKQGFGVINIQSLPKGAYLLRIESNQGNIFVSKLIKD